MIASFARQTLGRIRATTADDGHGNQTRDWAAATTELIPGWSVQPGATDELLAGRDATLIQWTAYGPGTADVLGSDRIQFAGTVYEIDGEPARWPSPTGALDHVVLLLKTWEG